MLDRKTKDRDASVELLKDRIKKENTSCICIMLAGTLTMVIALIFSLYDMLDSILLMMLGIGLIFIALYSVSSNNFRSLLIYFKTKGDKDG